MESKRRRKESVWSQEEENEGVWSQSVMAEQGGRRPELQLEVAMENGSHLGRGGEVNDATLRVQWRHGVQMGS